MQLELDIESKLDWLIGYEWDILRFDRILDWIEAELKRRHLFYFYEEIDQRQKLLKAVDRLTVLLHQADQHVL